MATCGARRAFAALPMVQHMVQAEASLSEVAGFACWRRKQAAGLLSSFEAWDSLDCFDKAGWVPLDPITMLAEEVEWIQLLAASCGLAATQHLLPLPA